jgi:Predicted nucleotidyltransferases
MTDPTAHLRELARRITDAYLDEMPLTGAILTGSGARGDADEFSDLDLIMYAAEVPPARGGRSCAARARGRPGGGAAQHTGPTGSSTSFRSTASSVRSA